MLPSLKADLLVLFPRPVLGHWSLVERPIQSARSRRRHHFATACGRVFEIMRAGIHRSPRPGLGRLQCLACPYPQVMGWH